MCTIDLIRSRPAIDGTKGDNEKAEVIAPNGEGAGQRKSAGKTASAGIKYLFGATDSKQQPQRERLTCESRRKT
jgi:hypothetical protein